MKTSSSRVLARFVLVVRVLAIFLSLQSSGLAHGLGDVICFLTGDVVGEHEDCGSHPDKDKNKEKDDNSDGCPPGCPNCHCSHGATALPLIGASSTIERRIPRSIEVWSRPHATDFPITPPSASLYRPPKRV